MKILSIETSCDETAISIVEVSGTAEQPAFRILSNVLWSQIDTHKEFGGVYPNLAKREHAKNLPSIFIENLKTAGLFIQKEVAGGVDPETETKVRELLSREGNLGEEVLKIANEIEKPDIDHIAVTTGPGLEPALWVGINFAKALGTLWNIPVVPVNHMEGHVLSVFIRADEHGAQTLDTSAIRFPVLSLLISGGHTELVVMRDWRSYEKIGATKDDAVGEAFDKTARLLGLPYPGGPKISELAREGNSRLDFKLPRPMIATEDFDFSFSGLKTSVLYLVKKLGELSDQDKKDVAREFEQAVVDVIVKKTECALSATNAETLIVGGGVSANTAIRTGLTNMLAEQFPNVTLHLPDQHLSTDNSLMIALAGYFSVVGKKSEHELVADSNWSL